MKKTCIQCGKEFELSDNEIAFFKSRKLELPKRCKECRNKNKKVGSIPSKIKYNYEGTSYRNNKTSAGFMNKHSYSSSIIIGFLIVLIFLFAGGIYSGQFFQESKNSENQVQSQTDNRSQSTEYTYQFRNDEYLTEHFEKHGSELGYTSKEDYLEGANKVISSSKSLHKLEAEDGDDVYFLESTSELVILSNDGYIRTYFKPEDGVEYFNRQ